MSKIVSGQIRAGRAFIPWSRIDLAKAAGVSIATIKRLEDGSHPVPDDAIERMQGALETEGVRFLPDDGDGPGVRLKHR